MDSEIENDFDLNNNDDDENRNDSDSFPRDDIMPITIDGEILPEYDDLNGSDCSDSDESDSDEYEEIQLEESDLLNELSNYN